MSATLTAPLTRTLRSFVPDPRRERDYLSVLDGRGIRVMDADKPAVRALVDAGYLRVLATGVSGYRRGGWQVPVWQLQITEAGRAVLADFP